MAVSYKITELWRYPIKSMGGEQLSSVSVRPGGIVGDRRWALRNAETNKIISAKRPRPYGRLLEWSAKTLDDGSVVVIGPDGSEFAAGSPELDQKLTAALGEPLVVVEVVPGNEETYDSEWPEIPGTLLSEIDVELPIAMMTDRQSFVDLAALHIVLEESLHHLGAISGADVGVGRFRPNLLIRSGDGKGVGEFVDLAWKDIGATAGDAELWIADAAPRCVMTTLGHGRFKPAKSILASLAASARKESDYGTFACFGTYAEVTSEGSISVGDQLVVAD
ncbi:MAG: MOSC domain-containing protein [Acidimicrobiaceae bacterium]|nr:MOSC domain-containing protein [Acidimicrobiaceae bacterium]